MPIFLLAFYDFMSASFLSLGVAATSISPKFDNLDINDEDFYNSLKYSESDKIEKIDLDASDLASNIENNILANVPVIDDSVNMSTQNPVTMPEYLAQQNELSQAQIEKTNSLIAQTAFQNDLLGETIKQQIAGNANSKLIAETLGASLPALVLQMQQLAKIPTVSKIASKIRTSEHEDLITTLKAMDLSVTNDVPVPSVQNIVGVPSVQNIVDVPFVKNIVNVPDNSDSLNAMTSATILQNEELSNITSKLEVVSMNAAAQQRVADHMNSKAVITRMDGTVYAELTPLELALQANVSIVEAKTKEKELADIQTTKAEIRDLDGNIIAELKPYELSAYKDVALVKAKEKEKEIGDYQTTPQALKNLDGNTVATMRPIEAVAVKNVVDAKNATDEMEFDIPDNILDNIFQNIPLPSFTNYDYGKQTDFMFNGGALDGN